MELERPRRAGLDLGGDARRRRALQVHPRPPAHVEDPMQAAHARARVDADPGVEGDGEAAFGVLLHGILHGAVRALPSNAGSSARTTKTWAGVTSPFISTIQKYSAPGTILYLSDWGNSTRPVRPGSLFQR